LFTDELVCVIKSLGLISLMRVVLCSQSAVEWEHQQVALRHEFNKLMNDEEIPTEGPDAEKKLRRLF
jgi:hypothetical protein